MLGYIESFRHSRECNVYIVTYESGGSDSTNQADSIKQLLNLFFNLNKYLLTYLLYNSNTLT